MFPTSEESVPPATHPASFLPVPEESVPSAVPSTYLPKVPAPLVVPVAPPTPSSSSSSTLLTLSMQQLEAIKGFGVFLYDGLMRKQFLRFLSLDEAFNIFKEHVQNIVNAFIPDAAIPPAKAPLIVQDTFKIPKFTTTKKTKKLTPTKPHCIEEDDDGEENKRNKDEDKAMMKRKKELDKLARQKKKAEEDERKQRKREEIKQRKELMRARRDSNSSLD